MGQTTQGSPTNTYGDVEAWNTVDLTDRIGAGDVLDGAVVRGRADIDVSDIALISAVV